jgi:hypothetical protein
MSIAPADLQSTPIQEHIQGRRLGDAYTISEHRGLLKSAGFRDSQVHPLLPTSFRAIVAAKG